MKISIKQSDETKLINTKQQAISWTKTQKIKKKSEA